MFSAAIFFSSQIYIMQLFTADAEQDNSGQAETEIAPMFMESCEPLSIHITYPCKSQ